MKCLWIRNNNHCLSLTFTFRELFCNVEKKIIYYDRARIFTILYPAITPCCTVPHILHVRPWASFFFFEKNTYLSLGQIINNYAIKDTGNKLKHDLRSCEKLICDNNVHRAGSAIISDLPSHS